MEKGAPTLGISVADQVKTGEAFGPGGPMERQMKGIAGTLHLTDEKDADGVGRAAIQLSRTTKLPVVIVVKGY